MMFHLPKVKMSAMKLATGLLVLASLFFTATILPAQAAVPAAQPSNRLVVSPEGPIATIQAALEQAEAGDTIVVYPGTYSGPLVVDKSVGLQGIGWPVIDGGGVGTVVTMAAQGSSLQGFVVRNSGVEPDRDHAGVTLTAPNIIIEGNRLEEVLFGIFLAESHGSIVRNNDITGKTEYDLARKGDGIRLWYSHDAIVENNHLHDTRDFVIWYSDNVQVRENLIEGGRYGIHLMYCDGAKIEKNQVKNNSVGIYTMYSNGVDLVQNDIRGQRGPSGYALGFKDADNVQARHNLLVDNRAGMFIDGTPFQKDGIAIFADNIVAYNDIGTVLLTSEKGARFENNTFWENEEQVAIQGGGSTGENHWSGNYWSDYTGFDENQDGLGEIAYSSDRFFERMTDREPMLRALAYSPAAQAIEFAATSFPVVKPQPKFTDNTPRTRPAILSLPPVNADSSRWLGLVGFGLVAVVLTGILLVWKEQY